MDSDEHILAHVVSVWRESKKFLSIGGREGMLILTDRHLMFIQKTEAKKKWWQAIVERQIVDLLKDKSKNLMTMQDGYTEKNLKIDLENEKIKRYLREAEDFYLAYPIIPPQMDSVYKEIRNAYDELKSVRVAAT